MPSSRTESVRTYTKQKMAVTLLPSSRKRGHDELSDFESSTSSGSNIDSVEESPTAGIHKLLSKTRTELAEKQKEKKAVTKAIARAKKMVREEQSNFRHLEDQGKMIQAEIRNLKEAKESVQDFVARRE